MDVTMKFKTFSLILATGLSLAATSAVFAEAPKVEFPAPSPACTLKQRVGLTDIEIDYSRPSIRGREIFGGLVPYGKVWRAGANQATKIIFSTPIKLNGTDVPAGTYALFAIPGKDEWTVIINKGAEQWGAYKYDEKDDVARVKAKPVEINRSVETFVINIDDIKDNSSELAMIWDKTKVPVKIEVNFADKLRSQIDAVMDSDNAKKPYFQAAMFYYNNNLDLQKAKKWVDAAIAEHDAHYIVYLKAEILKKLGDKEGAIAAAKHSSELAEKANEPGYVKLNADLISSLK
jgi:hypothetical protein